MENIPPEVALVVGFGPSESEQRVRIVGSKTERPEMRLEGKTKKDLWDDDNVRTHHRQNPHTPLDNNPNPPCSHASRHR